jgi:hypothetical protein
MLFLLTWMWNCLYEIFSFSNLQFQTEKYFSARMSYVIYDHQHYHHWQNSPFWTIAFLRRFCQICQFSCELDHPLFNSLDSAIIYTEQGRQPCVQTPNLQCQGGPLEPHAPGFLLVAFYYTQGYGEGILTHLHTGNMLWHINALPGSGSIHTSQHVRATIGRMFIARC